MKRLAAFTLAAAWLVAAPALAAETPPAGSPAEQAKSNPAANDKLICKTDQELGSRVGKRVCRTAAQIEDDRRIGQRVREDLRYQERPSSAPSRDAATATATAH